MLMADRKIEKTVPIPSRYALSEDSQLLGSMQIGESILFDDKTPSGLRQLANTHRDKVFTIRKVEGGVRIWRTA